MSDTDAHDGTTIRVRVTPELVARLDAQAERMGEPGVRITRSDVVRALLLSALEEREPAPAGG